MLLSLLLSITFLEFPLQNKFLEPVERPRFHEQELIGIVVVKSQLHMLLKETIIFHYSYILVCNTWQKSVCSWLNPRPPTSLTDDRLSTFDKLNKVRKISRHGGSAEIADDMVPTKSQSRADYFWSEAQTGTNLTSLSLLYLISQSLLYVLSLEIRCGTSKWQK